MAIAPGRITARRVTGGAARLAGNKAIITGGDSGIGRAVAIAYAREGASIVIAYLNEDEGAAEVKTRRGSDARSS
jgi:NAD(P)-dependent dehydrogenase (short-subunit alcohol dehydrogenase family)